MQAYIWSYCISYARSTSHMHSFFPIPSKYRIMTAVLNGAYNPWFSPGLARPEIKITLQIKGDESSFKVGDNHFNSIFCNYLHLFACNTVGLYFIQFRRRGTICPPWCVVIALGTNASYMTPHGSGQTREYRNLQWLLVTAAFQTCLGSGQTLE